MTIVIGYKTSNGVFLGADSQGSAGWDATQRKDKKVFIKHGIGYGFTSSYRMGQILQYHSEKIVYEEDMTPYEYTVSCLVPMWRRILKEHGYTTINNNEETGSIFLVAVKGELFKVEADFQVGEREGLFEATGCGQRYALGALRVLQTHRNLSSEYIIEEALDTAKYFSNGCGGDNTIIFIEKSSI